MDDVSKISSPICPRKVSSGDCTLYAEVTSRADASGDGSGRLSVRARCGGRGKARIFDGEEVKEGEFVCDSDGPGSSAIASSRYMESAAENDEESRVLKR
jgi:hypothetical protein